MKKILTYNHFLIPNFINHKKFEQYKSEYFNEWYETYRNFPLEGWSDYPTKDSRRSVFASSVWFLDRTKTIPHYLNVVYDSPIPEIKPLSQSFSEICLNRAKELIDSGQKINLFWSGGLDSTNMFFCLDSFNPKSQLKIYLTYDSIVESGNLFDKYIKNRYEYDLSPPKPPKEQIWDDGILLNGSGADQVFGMPYGITNENWMHPYTDYINTKEFDLIKPILEKFPVKIKTYFDFKWFQPFVFKYTAGKKIVYNGRNIRKEQNVIGFYDTEEFQIWSMIRNHDSKFINGDISTFKWPIRELLFELSGEKNYAYNKTKNNSNYSVYDPKWLFTTIDENGIIDSYDWDKFLKS